MTDDKAEAPLDFGVYQKRTAPLITPIELVAAGLSIIWLAGITFLFFGLDIASNLPDDGAEQLRLVMILLAAFLPIALIWVAASVAKTARVMREEADRLQTAISAMRHAYLEQAQSAGMGMTSQIEKKIEEIAAAQKSTETAIVTFASRRGDSDLPSDEKAALAPAAGKVAAEGQPALALGPDDSDYRQPISVAEFIKAANFPETPEDKEGFRSLRLALEDQKASKLIRSAQDVLTLLSEDGIYMDDLRPDRARPEVWRRFAQGERGRTVAALGGIRDRSCLALTSARMKADPIFRDAVHHFLRQFDRTLVDFEPQATDEELVKLSETRSARAFMLLGRVTRTFE